MRQCIASSLSNNFLPAGNVITGRLVKKSLFTQNSLHALYTLVLSHKTCELEIQVFERPLAMTNCTLGSFEAITFTITGHTAGKRSGSRRPLRVSSARARHPPCHAPSPYILQKLFYVVKLCSLKWK